jgi:glycosyltransferase involved in cell wall biosynthesis
VGLESRLALSRSKFLIISYLFPPAGGIAVQRSLALARYLAAGGHEVHVLKGNTTGPARDSSLLERIPGSVQVHESFAPEVPFALRHKLWSKLSRSSKPAQNSASPKKAPSRFSPRQFLTGAVKRILCPEPEILWVPFAIRKARRIIRRYRIEFLLVTVPPFSALVAGTALKREFPSITLVSDFRDEWLSFYLKDFEFQNSDYTRRRAEIIEREVVESSDIVVAVNRSSSDVMRRRYSDQPANKFAVVPNGYDPDIFATFHPRQNTSPRMVVTHVGTVYKTASPLFYLDALDRLPVEVRDNIDTRFIGRISESEAPGLQSRASKVRVEGFLPQTEALRFMEETDYLLLTMTNEISVPGKLYEYMASGKPILAITPHGSEVDEVVRETQCGLTAPPDSPKEIAAMLQRAYRAWRNREPLTKPRQDLIAQFDRRRLAEHYCHIMQTARAARQTA